MINAHFASAEQGPGVATTATPSGSAAAAPPASLPGLHFAAALVFLLAGAAALPAVAPRLAAGAFLMPGVVATTHLFTLGWITTSIMGALYQFLPVATGEPIRWQRLAYATLPLHATGLAAFAAGLARGQHALMLSGAAVMSFGVLVFVVNLAATLQRARRRDVTWWALACAALYLGVTLVLGVALTGNLRWGYMGAGRLASIGVHLHVALAGWVLLTMIGVAHRLLPMFLLSHGASDRWARAAVALVAGGAGVLTLLHHAPRLLGHWLPAALIGMGCAAFLLQAREYFVHRRRRVLDAGMRLAAAALVLLAGAMVLALPVLAGASLRLGVAYVMTALLAITLFVAAHYYRIVPFLVWYHRFGPLAGRRPVPLVSELFSQRAAGAAAALLAAGAVVLAGSVALGWPAVAAGGALLFTCGALVVCTQMLLLWRVRP